MERLVLGIGSNIDRERNIASGLDALVNCFGELEISSVYDCEAVGFSGQSFLNLVVATKTESAVDALAATLRAIETAHGRAPQATRYSSRHLDIDILCLGKRVGASNGVELPRAEILQNAFVLCPLAELLPDMLHPATGESFATLWRKFDQKRQQCQRFDFCWQGRQISRA